jgi:hypothetical protein
MAQSPPASDVGFSVYPPTETLPVSLPGNSRIQMIRRVTGEAVEREKKLMQLRNVSKKDKVSNGNDGLLV